MHKIQLYLVSATHSNWRQACISAYDKANKYYQMEINNQDNIISAILDPQFRTLSFDQLGIPQDQAESAMESLTLQYYKLTSTLIQKPEMDNESELEVVASKSNPDDPFINNIPIISMAPSKMAAKKKTLNELEAYLNNLHPSLEDGSIMDYWKV
ncbi:hypothetical protein O181_105093 [Austropuccinia psidii MF-1]|uniref:Uncharacterized protein n=1 Tax=Austropuccinia psidii MF-1 TaxID=1389203 RepID=A0A9Q3JND7_9BASI|nr:hypothetical protein [Austropuccinia psidii MF-1]